MKYIKTYEKYNKAGNKEKIIQYINDNKDKMTKFELLNKIRDLYNISDSIFYYYYGLLYPEERGLRTDDSQFSMTLDVKKKLIKFIKDSHGKLTKIQIMKEASELFSISEMTVYVHYNKLYPDEVKNIAKYRDYKDDLIEDIKNLHGILKRDKIIKKLSNKYNKHENIINRYYRKIYPDEECNRSSKEIIKEIEEFIKKLHGQFSKKEIVHNVIKKFNINKDAAYWHYKKLYPEEKKLTKKEKITKYIQDNHTKLSKNNIIDSASILFSLDKSIINTYYNNLYSAE